MQKVLHPSNRRFVMKYQGLPADYEKPVIRGNGGARGIGHRNGSLMTLTPVEQMVLRMAEDPEYEAEVKRTYTPQQLKKMRITF